MSCQGHPLAYDFATGMGLVLPLGPLGCGAHSASAAPPTSPSTTTCYVIGHGGRGHALKAEIFARREFAGYWEYLLDVALFTSPPHPEWSGAALLDRDGRLIGIGSLFVQEAAGDEVRKGNMFVPIDVLMPILDDLVKTGRAAHPPRPWLGDVRERGRPAPRRRRRSRRAVPPSARAFARAISSSPSAGSASARSPSCSAPCGTSGPRARVIPITLARDGATLPIKVRSADRGDFLKKPSLQ